MKRWNVADMLQTARRVFEKIHKRKTAVGHNHDIHFLAREIDDWLPKGIEAMANGSYVPRSLRRYYFRDEMVDQLHISDRIFQHVLLKQLKPTLPHIINPNCFHILGPSGVKTATQHIQAAMQGKNPPTYVIRADIRSYYRSIPHYKLLDGIRLAFDDPNVQAMLEEVVINSIDTLWGYKNPGSGIALRGPLSQLFSAIYLKPLDDAFSGTGVTYARYQDDIIILCRTKRQMNRCRRRDGNTS